MIEFARENAGLILCWRWQFLPS